MNLAQAMEFTTKHTLRILMLVVISVFVMATLVACGNPSGPSRASSDGSLQGTYELQPNADVWIDFNEDGSCLLHDRNGSYLGEYHYFESSKTYSIEFKDADGIEGSQTLKLEDGHLVTEDGSAVFAKKS